MKDVNWKKIAFWLKDVNWKKIAFWAVIAVVLVGGGLYLKFAGFGAALMSLVFFAVGGVCGWLGKMFYEKFIAPVIKTE